MLELEVRLLEVQERKHARRRSTRGSTGWRRVDVKCRRLGWTMSMRCRYETGRETHPETLFYENLIVGGLPGKQHRDP